MEERLRIIKECNIVDNFKQCPRVRTGEANPNNFCGGDGRISAYGNCDRFACEEFEERLDGFSKKDIVDYMVLEVISTIDKNMVLVVALNDFAKKGSNFLEKSDLVFDERGNIYFPMKNKPGVYHINRKIDEKSMKQVGRIFRILGEERNKGNKE